MSKLTDTQLVILSAASQRAGHVVVLPKTLKGGAATKVVNTLIAKGLIREMKARPDAPVWRRDEEEGQSYALVATRAELKAINVDDEAIDQPDDTPAKKAGDKKARAARERSGDAADGAPREGSKLALVIGMLQRSGRATIDAIVTATGWLPHTTRAALTGLRKRGYQIEKERGKDDKTTYRIVGEDTATTRKTRRAV
jgi:Protein of unknown function (DUF3489)